MGVAVEGQDENSEIFLFLPIGVLYDNRVCSILFVLQQKQTNKKNKQI